MSMAVLLIAAVVVAAAAFVQGTIGVGFAMIVVPVLALLAPETLPVCVLILMIPLNVYVVWREHGALDWHGTGWITAGRIVGTFFGLAVLLTLAPHHLGLLVGAATLLAAAVTLSRPAFAPSSRAFLTAGLVTGVTETATGIGGPPLALVYQHQPGPVIRATIAMCFLIGQVVSLGVLLAAGRMSFGQLSSAVLLVPAVIVGALASHLVHQRVEGEMLRFAMLAFALVSGVILVLHSLT